MASNINISIQSGDGMCPQVSQWGVDHIWQAGETLKSEEEKSRLKAPLVAFLSIDIALGDGVSKSKQTIVVGGGTVVAFPGFTAAVLRELLGEHTQQFIQLSLVFIQF